MDEIKVSSLLHVSKNQFGISPRIPLGWFLWLRAEKRLVHIGCIYNVSVQADINRIICKIPTFSLQCCVGK